MLELQDILSMLIHCLIVPFFLQQDRLQVLIAIIIPLHLSNDVPLLIQSLHKCTKRRRANLKRNSVESTVDSGEIGLKEGEVRIGVGMREYDNSRSGGCIGKREV